MIQPNGVSTDSNIPWPSNITPLAIYPSKSNPAKGHAIIKGQDGVIYCTCMAWKMSNPHTCKHLEDYIQAPPPIEAVKTGKTPVRNLRTWEWDDEVDEENTNSNLRKTLNQIIAELKETNNA